MDPRSIGQSSVLKADRVLLEGPHSHRTELWLVLRALRDFVSGFRALHFVGPCITVFGSARYDASHEYYAIGRNVGRGVAELGFTAMTGGGPGLMEAVNRGAREAGGRSVGCSQFAIPASRGRRSHTEERSDRRLSARNTRDG
jgi:hypothetical protein